MPGDTDELAWLQNGVYMFKGMFTRALVMSIELRSCLILSMINFHANLYILMHRYACDTRFHRNLFIAKIPFVTDVCPSILKYIIQRKKII